MSEDGGRVDSAEFRAMNQERTEQITSGLTNRHGIVSLRLPVGEYTVTIRAGGYRTVEIKDVSLHVAIPARVNVTLRVGDPDQVAESVPASETQSVINTSSAELDTLVDRRQILDLPLNGRNPLELSGLQAGVTTNSTLSQATINGLRGSYNDLVQDGVNIQNHFDRSEGLFGVTEPLVENTLEFSIVTQNSGADRGFGASQIRLVTPSGGNDYHGSVFYFHRNKALNANSFFNNASGLSRPDLRRNQFGGQIGGAIVENKLFFYGYYEGTREVREPSLTSSTLRSVLTGSARDGIFRYGQDQAESCDLADQNTVGACSVNLYSFTPLSLDSTIEKHILNSMPLPNDFSVGDGLNTAGFRFASSRPRQVDLWGLRLDFALSRSHSLEGVFSQFDLRLPKGLQNAVDPNRDIGERFPGLPGGGRDSVRRMGALTWNANLGRALTNEVRWGWQRSSFDSFAREQSINDLQLELPLVDNPLQNLLAQRQKNTSYEYAEHLSWHPGGHNVRFGAELRSVSTLLGDDNGTIPSLRLGFGRANPLARGEALFPGEISLRERERASELLALLTGVLDSATQTFNINSPTASAFVAGEGAERRLRQRFLSFYGTDSYRLGVNLTLNLGLRWEWHTVPTEGQGLALLPVGGLEALSRPDALLDWAGGESGRSFFGNDLNNLAPTIGLAWDPFGDGRTSLRAGYTVSYVVDNSLPAVKKALDSNPGWTATKRVSNLTGTVNLSRDNVLPLEIPTFKIPRTLPDQLRLNPLNGLFAIDPEFRTPYVQQWNLSLSRQVFPGTIFEVRYVGNRGVGLARAIDLNQSDSVSNGFLEDFKRAQFNLERTGNPYQGLSLQIFPLLSNRGQTLLFDPRVQDLLRTGELGELLFLMFENQRSVFGESGAGAPSVLGPEFFYPNPNALFTSFLGNNSFSSYHSLQTELRRRFSRGMSFQGNYTFSKVLTDFSGTPDNLSPLLDVSRLNLERRRASFDVNHSFAGNFLWELPVGPGRRYASSRGPLGRILEGWQMSSIIHWRSGPPISIISGRGTFVRRDYSQGNSVDTTLSHSELRSMTGDFRDPNGNPLLFDTRLVESLHHPEVGQVGTLGLTPLSGPSYANVDMSLIKRTRLGENTEVEVHVEFFNLLNHVNWQVSRNQPGEAVQKIGDVNFGRISDTFDPRIVQLALKLNF